MTILLNLVKSVCYSVITLLVSVVSDNVCVVAVEPVPGALHEAAQGQEPHVHPTDHLHPHQPQQIPRRWVIVTYLCVPVMRLCVPVMRLCVPVMLLCVLVMLLCPCHASV